MLYVDKDDSDMILYLLNYYYSQSLPILFQFNRTIYNYNIKVSMYENVTVDDCI